MSEASQEGESSSPNDPWLVITSEYQSLKKELSLCVQAQNDRLFMAVQSHFKTSGSDWIDPFCTLTGVDRSGVHHRRRSLQHQYLMTRKLTMSQRECDSLQRQVHRVRGVADAVQAELESRKESIEKLRRVYEAAQSLRRFLPNKSEVSLALQKGPMSVFFGRRLRAIYGAARTLNNEIRHVAPRASDLDLSMMDARHYRDILNWFDGQASKIPVLSHSVEMHRDAQHRYERKLQAHESAQRFLHEHDPHSLDQRVFRLLMDRCWRKSDVIHALKANLAECPDMGRYVGAQARLSVMEALAVFMDSSDVQRLPFSAKEEPARQFVSEAMACLASYEFSSEPDPYPEMAYFVDLMKDKPRDSKVWGTFLWLVEQLKTTHPRDIWLERMARGIASEQGNDSRIMHELQDVWGFPMAQGV